MELCITSALDSGMLVSPKRHGHHARNWSRIFLGTDNVQRNQLPLTLMLGRLFHRIGCHRIGCCGDAMALRGDKLLVADTGGDRVVVLAAISLELLCVFGEHRRGRARGSLWTWPWRRSSYLCCSWRPRVSRSTRCLASSSASSASARLRDQPASPSATPNFGENRSIAPEHQTLRSAPFSMV